MRLVFTTWAWPSHLYAMVPLAWACRTSGHEVLVASQPQLTEAIHRTGLPSAPIGRDVDPLPTFRAIVAPPAPDGGGRAGGPRSGPRVLELLTALADAMVDDLIRLCRGWRADAVVFEPTALAGPLAAAVLDLPAVRHLYGTDLLGAAGQFLEAALGPLSRRLGLSEVNPYGVASVDPCPAGLQVATGSRRLPMRYLPYNGAGPMRRLLSPRGRPRVCVTWGTTLSRLDPELSLAGPVARAIDGRDLDVVVAVTEAQRPQLGPLPADVQVVESMPLHLLLPSCDAVVSHGGAGTLLTAVANGLPQLAIPRLPDHVRHTAQLVSAGAGIQLPAPEADRAAIGDQVRELLATPAYRAAAAGLRSQMREQPTPAQLVGRLEQLTRDTAVAR